MAALQPGIKKEPEDGMIEAGKQFSRAAGNKKCDRAIGNKQCSRTAGDRKCGRAVVRKYCGNEDAAKVMLKIIKLLSENSGGV